MSRLCAPSGVASLRSKSACMRWLRKASTVSAALKLRQFRCASGGAIVGVSRTVEQAPVSGTGSEAMVRLTTQPAVSVAAAADQDCMSSPWRASYPRECEARWKPLAFKIDSPKGHG